MIEKLSIIIPSYNEERTIIKVLEILRDLELVRQLKKEIIVINDCSQDNTQILVESFIQQHPESDIHIYKQEINKGKGAALHLGIQKAKGDYLIPQDADLELDPNEINLLLEKAIYEDLDVVYGSRFLNKKYANKNASYYANQFLTALSNLLSGLSISDMESCYKLMRSSIIKEISLKEERFGFEPEVTAKLAKIKGIRISEVPVSYEFRSYDEGKKIGWTDGLKAIYCILKYNL